MSLTTWVVSVVLGWGLVALSAAHLGPASWSAMGEPMLMITALVLVSGFRRVVMTRFPRDPVLISHAFVFAALYLWGIHPAAILMAVSVAFSEILDRKPARKLVFNVGQYTLSLAMAWAILVTGGSRASPTNPTDTLNAGDLTWILLAWIVYHLLNLALVAGVDDHQSWWASFSEEFWFFTSSTFAVLALSPLVAVVAVAGESSWTLLPLLLIPLFSVQHIAAMTQERDYRAMHDPLTGLPNRVLLTDQVEAMLVRAARAPRTAQGAGRVRLIFLDLDAFEVVNDGIGHDAGDALLVDVASRLSGVLRPDGTLARFLGDEFALACDAMRDNELDELLGDIRSALEQPFRFADHEVALTACLGVATATQDSTAQSLLREADSAMSQAKKAGRSQVAYFHSSMHTQATARLDEHLGLRRAMERDELRAVYQPIVDLSSGEVLGLEALLRWEHPERGLIGPDQFVPMAEETDLILPLGDWMIDRALGQLARWRQGVPGTARMWVAVNLSPLQIEDPDLTPKIRRALQDWGIPPESLHLEITESQVMRSVERSTNTLDALKALGVRLIIDDFGTGYSSLARLKSLPVSALKIDQSFMDGLDTGTSDLSLVNAITQMARALNLDVIAEGIETPSQLRILKTIGVPMGQGFLWSPPMRPDRFVEWFQTRTADAPTSARPPRTGELPAHRGPDEGRQPRPTPA